MKRNDYLPQITRNPLSAFFKGAGLPLRGLSFLLNNPRLWIFVLIPLVINAILFVILLTWGYSAFSDVLKSWLGSWDTLAWYWKSVAVVARIFFWLVALLAVYFIFTPSALVIAAPFNDYLAETTEKACGLEYREERPLVAMIIKEAGFAIAGELKRVLFFGAVFLLLLPINLVPFIGSVAYAIFSFVWACFGFSFEFISFATDRRHVSLNRKLAILRKNLPFTMGYGLVTLLLFLIPFVNVLIVPVSAVSGTLLFCTVVKSGSKREEAV